MSLKPKELSAGLIFTAGICAALSLIYHIGMIFAGFTVENDAYIWTYLKYIWSFKYMAIIGMLLFLGTAVALLRLIAYYSKAKTFVANAEQAERLSQAAETAKQDKSGEEA